MILLGLIAVLFFSQLSILCSEDPSKEICGPSPKLPQGKMVMLVDNSYVEFEPKSYEAEFNYERKFKGIPHLFEHDEMVGKNVTLARQCEEKLNEDETLLKKIEILMMNCQHDKLLKENEDQDSDEKDQFSSSTIDEVD